MQMGKWEVRFRKDENNGLPYIDLWSRQKTQQHCWCRMAPKKQQTCFFKWFGRTTKVVPREVLEAKEARCVMGIIGNPSKRDFKGMVSGNMIRNCPVTTDAITNASAIFCPDLASVRGKTVRRMPEQVVGDYLSGAQDSDTGSRSIVCRWNIVFNHCIETIKFIKLRHVATHTAKSLNKHMQ